MTQTSTYQQIGRAAQDQAQALFAPTVGYVAGLPVSAAMHWGHGAGSAAPYGTLAGSLRSLHAAYGLPLVRRCGPPASSPKGQVPGSRSGCWLTAWTSPAVSIY